MTGFRKFILRGNVVDLAVAVIIGAAFAGVVKAFTEGFITPLIGVFGGIPDFSTWSFMVRGSSFPIGAFINALLSFLIIAAVVFFFVVKPMNALLERMRREPTPDPLTAKCPECLSEVQVGARRCPFCTSALAIAPD